MMLAAGRKAAREAIVGVVEILASGGGVYSDALAELDFRTGQVLDAIDQAGIADNTLSAITTRMLAVMRLGLS